MTDFNKEQTNIINKMKEALELLDKRKKEDPKEFRRIEQERMFNFISRLREARINYMKTKLPEVKWRCLAHGYVSSSYLEDNCPQCEEYNRENLVAGNIYEHYKGGEYKVIISDAIFEHNQEQLVVYIDNTDPYSIHWVRSYKDFTFVFPDGTPRFKYLRNECD